MSDNFLQKPEEVEIALQLSGDFALNGGTWLSSGVLRLSYTYARTRALVSQVAGKLNVRGRELRLHPSSVYWVTNTEVHATYVAAEEWGLAIPD